MFQFFVYGFTAAIHIALSYVDYYIQWANDILDFYAPGM